MGIFGFPRLNVKGLLQINVGTANNDDYSADAVYQGQPLRLFDSVQVQPLTYGMGDDEFIDWIQKDSLFALPSESRRPAPRAAPETQEGRTRSLLGGDITHAERSLRASDGQGDDPASQRFIPAEWNYYGDMGLTFLDTQVLSIQRDASTLVTDPSQESMIGARVSFNNRPDATGRSTGMLIDINAEDVPCSQIFADCLLLEKGGQALFLGKPSKAVTRWINFQRTLNLTGPNGAAGTFQCVVPLDQLTGSPILDLLPSQSPDGRRLAGLVFRYVIYRPLQRINTFDNPGDGWFTKIRELYQQRGINPDVAQVIGTIAPWFEGEMASVPVGRLLNPTTNSIPVPVGYTGNFGDSRTIQLAPAVVSVDAQNDLVSIDLSTALPDVFTEKTHDPYQTRNTSKFDFGPLSLQVRSSTASHDFGPIPYQSSPENVPTGDQRGWLFDFSSAGVPPELLTDGTFYLHSARYGDLLQEADYFIASDQACLYAEQVPDPGSTTSSFINDSGTAGPATIRVFRKGVELTGESCPAVYVWEYDSTPNQDQHEFPPTPDPTGPVSSWVKLAPGEALKADVSKPGNRLFTFTVEGQTLGKQRSGAQPPVPSTYADLSLGVAPMINLRILPNDKDYSEYYQDSKADPPVGNDKLTFDVVYQEVLRTYYLLYPAMNQQVALDDPDSWTDPVMARHLLQRTQLSWFDKAEYMPRTRDLSRSRRQLLQAWALKIINQGGA